MIVLTSAKSRLMTPGLVIRSEIPAIPWRNTSSAIWNASVTVVFGSTMWSSRSFGMVISASTVSRRRAIPSSAARRLRPPSNSNGLVTTATVSAPAAFASRATVGDAPVPVPPPMPAAMKIMSQSFITSARLSALSSAARSPISGRPPAPRPLVSLSPIRMAMVASLLMSAWASVLTATNSIPSTPERTIRLIALPPAPPTPMTLIRANAWASDSNELHRGEGVLDPSCEAGT